MQVVVDQPSGVLKVEAFGKHVGGDQDADLCHALLRRVPRSKSRCSTGRRRITSPRSRLSGVSISSTPSMPASIELLLEVAGGVRELGEDENLVLLEHRIGLQELDKGL